MDINDKQKIVKMVIFNRKMRKGSKKNYFKEERMIITEENLQLGSHDVI
jgi:hypothetical protein